MIPKRPPPKLPKSPSSQPNPQPKKQPPIPFKKMPPFPKKGENESQAPPIKSRMKFEKSTETPPSRPIKKAPNKAPLKHKSIEMLKNETIDTLPSNQDVDEENDPTIDNNEESNLSGGLSPNNQMFNSGSPISDRMSTTNPKKSPPPNISLRMSKKENSTSILELSKNRNRLKEPSQTQLLQHRKSDNIEKPIIRQKLNDLPGWNKVELKGVGKKSKIIKKKLYIYLLFYFLCFFFISLLNPNINFKLYMILNLVETSILPWEWVMR